MRGRTGWWTVRTALPSASRPFLLPIFRVPSPPASAAAPTSHRNSHLLNTSSTAVFSSSVLKSKCWPSLESLAICGTGGGGGSAGELVGGCMAPASRTLCGATAQPSLLPRSAAAPHPGRVGLALPSAEAEDNGWVKVTVLDQLHNLHWGCVPGLVWAAPPRCFLKQCSCCPMLG